MPKTSKPKPGFSKVLELWMDSDLKVQILVFYHDNPGVLETMAGLALRLGTSVERLRKDLAGHVALGILQERKIGAEKILVFDRKREGEVQKEIEKHIEELARKGASK